jgi:hypothetical protein
MTERQRTIGVMGSGLVASRVIMHAAAAGVATRTARAESLGLLDDCPVVVLAGPSPHAALVDALAREGRVIVSVGDDLEDVMALMDRDRLFIDRGTTLVVGAAASPGMTALLVRWARDRFDDIDEVHVAAHGTGGPSCARQHHRALGGMSVGWHDGSWLQRPAGSGRELCWFPDPIGPRDCYRHASPDPVLVQRAFPELRRITARVSATRRDRLTARLPMMSPPHPEGGLGALRVEVRGTRDGARSIEVLGVVERAATIAGTLAAQTALVMLDSLPSPGVLACGEDAFPSSEVMSRILATGTVLHEFVGT